MNEEANCNLALSTLSLLSSDASFIPSNQLRSNLFVVLFSLFVADRYIYRHLATDVGVDAPNILIR